MKKCAIILCGGSSTRSNLGYNKVFYPLGQKNVLETVADKFLDWDRIVIVVNEHDKEIYDNHAMASNLRRHPNAPVTAIVSHNDLQLTNGGTTRSQSVYNGLLKAKGCDIVAIHDGARPFVNKELIDKAVQSAIEFGSGIPALKVVDSIKTAEAYTPDRPNCLKIISTVARNNLYSVQTPQVFRYAEIWDAYNKAEILRFAKDDKNGFEDDSEIYRLAGYKPIITPGDPSNKKLTSPSDFFPAHSLSKIGTGFDVHQLIKNRPLILGGIVIPYEKGLLGHSDADVLTHAIMDALLSSAGLKDIGHQFPDSDNKYKNANSCSLLKKVAALLKEKKISIKSISAVIIAQAPRLASYLDAIRDNLCSTTELKKDCLSISATTTEFMGIVGNGGAIAASAVCLCE